MASLGLNELICWIVLKIIKKVFSFYILDFVLQNKTKLTMKQPYMFPILYCQYYACRYPGDLRSQGIGRHGIDLISQNIPSLASEELRYAVCVHYYMY